jgi:hypothetical protein
LTTRLEPPTNVVDEQGQRGCSPAGGRSRAHRVFMVGATGLARSCLTRGRPSGSCERPSPGSTLTRLDGSAKGRRSGRRHGPRSLGANASPRRSLCTVRGRGAMRRSAHPAHAVLFSNANPQYRQTSAAALIVSAQRGQSFVTEDGSLRIRDGLRLDDGLTDEQRQEIVQRLVRVRVVTDADETGRPRSVRAIVEYAFPGALQTVTDIREELNYTVARRVIELPVGRRRSVVGAR